MCDRMLIELLKLEEDYLKNNLNRIYERLDSEVKELKPETQYRSPFILRPAIIFMSVFLVLILLVILVIFTIE